MIYKVIQQLYIIAINYAFTNGQQESSYKSQRKSFQELHVCVCSCVLVYMENVIRESSVPERSS